MKRSSRRCSAISNELFAAVTALGVGCAAAGLVWVVLKIYPGYRAGISGGRSWGKNVLAAEFLGLRWWAWAGGAAVLATGLPVFKNPVPAIFAAALCLLVPNQLVYQQRRKHQLAVLEQFAAAIRIFAAEFAVSTKLERCFAAVARSIPGPVGSVFRRSYLKLVYGMPFEEVLQNMSRELDLVEGQLFVELLRLAREHGVAIAPLFHDLVSRVTIRQELEKINRGEIFGDRVVGLILVLLPLPLYFLLQVWLPEARSFLVNTVAGRTVVTLCFASAIGWFFVDRAVNRV